ncbi:MAG: YkgJ family cysteine cluster protein, partial [Promethearchaeota archaeon]
MNTQDQIKFDCIRCGNCCSDPNTIVNLSYSDLLRIKKGLNLDLDELLEIVGFYIFEGDLNEKLKKKMVSPPIRTERGYSFVGLLKNNSGACIFYDAVNNRCKIYSLRPNFCRTFPFTFQPKQDSEDLEVLITQKGKQY